MRALSTRGRRTILTGAGVGLAIIGELLALQAVSGGLSGMNSGATSTTATTATSLAMHNVTFHVIGICSSDSAYFSPWGVKLGNSTKTAPSDATVAEIQNASGFDSTVGNATIAFSVPDGTYSFILYPTDSMHVASADGNPVAGPTGSLAVSGLDVFVHVLWIPSGGFCR